MEAMLPASRAFGPSLAALAALATAVPAPARAQESAAVLRGRIETDSGIPLPYAMVRLAPLGRRQFADAHGLFAFAAVPEGVYRLAVRQIGFVPLDTAVTLPAGATALRLQLRHLPVRLTAIDVEAEGPCRVGSTAGAHDPALAPIFAQLFVNAERFELLADEYPFVYRMQRAATELNLRDETVWQAMDTIDVRSDERWKYEPGQLLRPGLGPGGRPARLVQVPQLPDLADSAFRARHCFTFLGEVELAGSPALLIGFRAAEGLLSLDAEGQAWLDARTYAVRRISFDVVPAWAIPNTQSISVTADFREVQPFVLVPRRIFTLTQLVTQSGGPATRQEEEQRLLRVHFLRPLDERDAQDIEP